MKPKLSTAFRILLLAAVLVGWIGLLPAATPALAQSGQSGLTMKATAAYGGYFKYGEWLPVWVELQNQGRDLDAEVRIQVNGSQGTLIFAAPVSLPSGAHKLLPVYVLPNNFSRELDIRLVSNGKDLLTGKATVHPQPNISYFVGILSPQRGALALLNGLRLGSQDRPKILVDLTTGELPDRAEALRSFDLLIFNDVDTSKLSPEQAAALAGWVQQGGRLVIGGGAGAQKTIAGLPADLLPVQLQSTTEVNAEALKPLAAFAGSEPIAAGGPFVAARATAAGKTGHILVGDTNLPLVQEIGWGSGSVDFVAFELTGVPFNGWPGATNFWASLIGPGGAYPENLPFDVSPRQYRASSLTYALSNIPSLDLPSVQGLSILLGIYILIVGPLNYLVLRRLHRLHLAWVSIPLITALFTAGAFGIGYTMRGNDLILNKIALIETKQDGNAAVTSYMGLFSPRMQSYEVSVEGESLISPMSGFDQGQWGGAQPTTGSQMTFIQGQPSTVKGLTVNQWAMQSFMSEGTWEDFGAFSARLHIENDTLVGTVRNDTNYTLTDVVLVMQSRFTRLGDMAPGTEKEVSLGLSSLQSDRFGPPLSYRLFQERFTNGGPMPRDIEQKSNIISNLFENGPWAKISSSMQAGGMAGTSTGPLVFGWLDQAPPNVQVPGNRLTQKATALVYSTLNYELPKSGFLTIPPGLIPGSLVKMPSDAGNCGIGNSIHMGRGQAEFKFQVPNNLEGFQVNNLKLAIYRDTGNPVGMPEIALYNWNSQGWTNIQEPVQGTNIIQNAGPYVSDSGEMRVQLNSQSDQIGCLYLDMGLEAQPTTGHGG